MGAVASLRAARSVALGLASFAAGVVTGVSAVAVARTWPGWLLAVAGTAALLLALPVTGGRRALAAVGWVLGLVVVVLGRPEGDYAVSGDARGVSLIGVSVLVIGAAALSLPSMRR